MQPARETEHEPGAHREHGGQQVALGEADQARQRVGEKVTAPDDSPQGAEDRGGGGKVHGQVGTGPRGDLPRGQTHDDHEQPEPGELPHQVISREISSKIR